MICLRMSGSPPYQIMLMKLSPGTSWIMRSYRAMTRSWTAGLIASSGLSTPWKQ